MVEVEVCLVLLATIKALVATPRVIPTSGELWGIFILLPSHCWDILGQSLIAIFNHAWKKVVDQPHIFVVYYRMEYLY